MEETGATIGPATESLTLTEPGGKVTVVQHYFRTEVLDTDPNRRSGPELDDPDLGNFSPVRVAWMGCPRAAATRRIPWRRPQRRAARTYTHETPPSAFPLMAGSLGTS